MKHSKLYNSFKLYLMLKKQHLDRKLDSLKDNSAVVTATHLFQENKKRIFQTTIFFSALWFLVSSFIMNIHCSKKYTKLDKIPNVELEILHQQIKQERMFDDYIKSGAKINESN